MITAAREAGVPIRVARSRGRQLWQATHVPLEGPRRHGRHEAQNCLDFLKPWGWEGGAPAPPRLVLTRLERAAGPCGPGPPAPRPVLGVATRSSGSSAFPSDPWWDRALRRSWRPRGWSPVVLSPPEASALAPTDLRGLLGRLAACDAFLGPSTGPTQLAAALDVPVLALMGLSSNRGPSRWAPLGRRVQVLQYPGPEADLQGGMDRLDPRDLLPHLARLREPGDRAGPPGRHLGALPPLRGGRGHAAPRAEAPPDDRAGPLVVWGPKLAVSLVEGHPLADAVVPDEGKPGPWAMAALLRRHRAARSIHFPKTLRPALAAFLARVPERIGVDESLAGFFNTHSGPFWDAEGPFLERYHAVLARRWPDLPPMPFADYAPAVTVGTPAGPYLCLMPGSTWPSKAWPGEHFRALARKARLEGFEVVVLGTRGEEAICDRRGPGRRPGPLRPHQPRGGRRLASRRPGRPGQRFRPEPPVRRLLHPHPRPLRRHRPRRQHPLGPQDRRPAPGRHPLRTLLQARLLRGGPPLSGRHHPRARLGGPDGARVVLTAETDLHWLQHWGDAIIHTWSD